jgi:hypothetical protein
MGLEVDRWRRLRCGGGLKVVVGLLLAWGMGRSGEGAPPVLTHLFPAGAGVGSSNTVILAGKWDPWPPKIWVEGAGVSWTPTTNAGRVSVEIASDAIPGPRWVRVFNGDGASEPRLFVVGASAELLDAEPNNAFAKAQRVEALPATINGRLDKNGDVDSFAVSLGAGEWLEARLDAYTLMSTVDAVLRVVSAQGQPLAWNHDSSTLDPRLSWQSTSAQTVVVQVFGFKYPADASIQLTGGEGAVYRLHLRSSADLSDARTVETTDSEPPGVSEVPAMFRGVLLEGRPEPRHRFRALKDQLYSIRVAAQAIGAPWDARLRVVDGQGKELAQNDDAEGSSDPRLDWRAPAEGEYGVVVASRLRQRGSQCRYELSILESVAGFRATATSSAWVLSAGATNEVTVLVDRLHGFTNELRIVFGHLPEGVTAEPGTNGPTGKREVSLRLVAATNAPAFSAPVELMVMSADLMEPRPVVHELISRGENNGVPQGYSRLMRESIDRFWLTVRPAELAAKP